MSTQQILGVVGGVVGAFFGYPQLGFVVGSLVGGLLTPAEKIEGPRVDDLKVQVSTYGAGIPILYGTERVGGNVVWSTDKQEVEETQGGKGGPEQTTYRYYVHMGIVLCETPRDGSIVNIVQIFQDGKLIYDARSGIPLGSALASSENPHAYFVMYQGHADQLPDPGEEAWMGGPGSVPAYRGVVRIRMNAVECPGGRVPQFSFVITNSAKQADTAILGSDFFRAAHYSANGLWSIEFKIDETINVYWTDGTSPDKFIRKIDLNPSYLYHSSPCFIAGVDSPTALFGRGRLDGMKSVISTIDLPSGAILDIWEQDLTLPGPANSGDLHAAFDRVTNRYAIPYGDGGFDGLQVVTPNSMIVECDPTDVFSQSPVAFHDSIVYVLNIKDGKYVLACKDADTGVHIGTFDGPATTAESVSASAMQTTDSGIYAFLWKVPNLNKSSFYQLLLTKDIDGNLTAIDWVLKSEDVAYVFGNTPAGNGKSVSVYYLNDGIVVGPGILVSGVWQYTRFATYDPIAIPVSGIISDLCQRAGEYRFDVTGVPDADTLNGYKLQNPASARSNIDPLLTAFAIYIVDEDGTIKFKKYEDISSQASIAYDELGQSEDSAEAPDAMPLNRAQEIDMPRSVSVSYIEPAFDFQTASEKDVRQITEATEDMVVELPIATSSDHAKQVASMILFAKWRAQNTRSFKTSRKYAFLSPGDGVTVEYPRGTLRLWRVTSMTDTGALCEFNVEPGDAELYAQTATGATGYVGQQVAPLASPTRLQLLDIPLLRDQDNNAGIYAAFDNFGSGWAGAELLVGYDDASLASRGTVSTDAPIGFAETILGNAPVGFVDESNIVTVNIGNNDFESVTRDVLLANGGEFWAYGLPGRWEIGASALGDALGDGRYILSRHLRGLFGTEANASLHQAGDIFVLLRIAGMLRPSMGVGDIGQAQQYRAVSKGRSLNSAASQSYTNSGEGLRPLSPINLRRSDSNDLSVDRRSRLSMNNSSGSLPLGEATEAWAWEFYTTGGFATLIGTAFTTSATVTAAQITAAGATPSATLYVRVSQISDSVGRGHELQATI